MAGDNADIDVGRAGGTDGADRETAGEQRDTGDGRELATYLRALSDDARLGEELRANGAQTAARYTWANALESLDRKIVYVEAIAK